MSVVTFVYYAIECDQCGERLGRSDTATAAAMWAASNGWQVAVNGEDPGRDLCPDCVGHAVTDRVGDLVHEQAAIVDYVGFVGRAINEAIGRTPTHSSQAGLATFRGGVA